jgi:hypothetical protein
MPEICSKYAVKMQQVCTLKKIKCAVYMHLYAYTICKKYARNLNMQKYARNMQYMHLK